MREPGPYAGTIVDSFALYAIQLKEPLLLPDRTVRSVVALRRWPGLDAIVSHDSYVVVRLFLLPESLESLQQLDLLNLSFDPEANGAIRLSKT
jgi:hypothetical protein